MGFLKNLRVKTKMLGVFGFVLVLLCVISAMSVKSLLNSAEVADNVRVLVSERFEKVVSLNNNVVLTNNALSDYLTPGNLSEARRRTYETAFINVGKEIQEIINDPSVSAQVKEVDALFKRYDYLYNIVISPLIDAGRPYDALAFYLAEMQPMASQMVASTGQMCRVLMTELDSGVTKLQDMRQIYFVLIVTTIAVVIGVCVAFLFSREITNHLRYAIDVANNIANNNLQIDIKVDAKDEFGELGNALKLMRNDLSKSIATVRAIALTLNHQLDETKNSADVILNSSKEAESNAISVAAASNEMVSTTREIASNCEKAATLSDQSHSVTNESVDIIKSTIADIRVQSEHTVEDARKVQALAEQTKQIDSIVGTIDEIAAQTNLLALNAAIEAARAGEAGRGFAVVADEVRALASRTSQSTQEISSMVQQIQQDANAATESMHNSVENMNSVAERANSVEATLNSILEYVGQVNQQIRMIATSAEEQTTATAEISHHMQQISADSEEVVQGAHQSNSNCDNSVNSVRELVHSLENFKLYEEKTKRDLQRQFLNSLDNI